MDSALNSTEMDTACGTPHYMSPEMLRGELYSNLVDLWALGMVVFVMLSGEHPFKGQNRPQLYNSILNGLYSLQSKVTDILKTCMYTHRIVPNTRLA